MPTFRLSPHIGEHEPGPYPIQDQPVSTLQVDEQPSLLAMFPSSHPSKPFFNPSPHIGLQVPGP